MSGGVEAGGEKPPAIRLSYSPSKARIVNFPVDNYYDNGLQVIVVKFTFCPGDIMEIKDFICDLVFSNSSQKLSKTVSEQFGISRQAAQKHIRKLIDAGILTMAGTTNSATYKLALLVNENQLFNLSPKLDEDAVWRSFVRPKLDDIPHNIISICQYGFTEMFNNVIDHSEGKSAFVTVQRSAFHVEITVMDDGIGIFRKIRRDFGLDDERHAILELSKGKLTSDPSRHSGEGIFFTSRMFDRFAILSGNQYFSHTVEHDDWLLDADEKRQGTSVFMEIRLSTKRNSQEVFEEYATIDHPGFYKTHVPVALAQYGDENMISRSQAKRVLVRVEKFTEVILDFKGVSEVGQAFVDEIFRVFSQSHPDVHLIYINANESIDWMIRRSLATTNANGFSI
jgi:anti-sigma regulatory factor (Ser/Thr protein kinase)